MDNGASFIPQDFSGGPGVVSSASPVAPQVPPIVDTTATHESSKYARKVGMKRMKAFFVGGIVLALLIIAGVGVISRIRESTDQRSKAAVNGVYLSPIVSAQTVEKGQTFPVEIKMVRKGKTVSMVELQVQYDPAVLELTADPNKPADPIPGVYDVPGVMPFPKIIDPTTGAQSDPPFAVKSVQNGVIRMILGSRIEQENGEYKTFPYGSKGSDLEAVTIATVWFKVKETTTRMTYVTVAGDKVAVIGSQDNMFEGAVSAEVNIKQGEIPPIGNAYVVCPEGSTLQGCNYYGLVGLQEAVNAQPNDASDPTKTVILVKEGTYSRSRNQITSDSSQTVYHIIVGKGKNVQIIGEGNVVLDGLGENKVIMISTTNGSNAKLSITNLIIQESTIGILVTGSATATINGSQMTNNTGVGLDFRETVTATVTNSTILGSAEGILVSGSATATINGSQITNNTGAALKLQETATATVTNSTILGSAEGILVSGSATATINGSQITNNTGVGLKLLETATATINGSQILGNNWNGIEQWSGQLIISSSVIGKNGVNGLFQRDGQADIQNCLIIQNGDNGIGSYASVEVVNSTISDNGSMGVFLTDNADFRMMNSVVTGNMSSTQPAGLFCGQQSKISAFSYNDVHGNANGEFFGCDDPTGKDGNISVDPQFVGGCDYHLQQSSPLANAGEPTILDPDGTRSDIGAYGGVHAAEIPSNATSACDVQMSGVVFTFGFKMQGVNKSGVKRTVTLDLKSENDQRKYVVLVESDSNGVFRPVNQVQLTYVKLGQQYDVFVKHDVYLRKKLGTMSFSQGMNTAPGSWDSQQLLAGDFVHDNGGENLLDTMDIAKFLSIYDSFEVPVNSSNMRYNINDDGFIDVMDIGFILANLNSDNFFDGLSGD